MTQTISKFRDLNVHFLEICVLGLHLEASLRTGGAFYSFILVSIHIICTVQLHLIDNRSSIILWSLRTLGLFNSRNHKAP
jgi:hypothetical protein